MIRGPFPPKAVHERDRIARRLVVKAKHDQIDLPQDFPLGGGILAKFRRDASRR